MGSLSLLCAFKHVLCTSGAICNDHMQAPHSYQFDKNM